MRKGVYTYCSDRVTHFLGYTPEEMIGTTPFDSMCDDEKQRVGQIFAELVAKQKPMIDFEYSRTNKNGDDVVMRVNGIPVIDKEGNLTGYRGTDKDITAQKRMALALSTSENKFRTLYESNSDAIMMLDDNGFFDCNPAALNMFGCATKEEFCSLHPFDVSPSKQPDGSDSMKLAQAKIGQAMIEGSCRFEWVHKRMDTGKDFPAEVFLTSVELDGKKSYPGIGKRYLRA